MRRWRTRASPRYSRLTIVAGHAQVELQQDGTLHMHVVLVALARITAILPLGLGSAPQNHVREGAQTEERRMKEPLDAQKRLQHHTRIVTPPLHFTQIDCSFIVCIDLFSTSLDRL